MNTNEQEFLCVKSLSIRRGNQLVLKGLEFSLSVGTGLCLQGANGSGKTTLLRCLAGLVDSDRGQIYIAGDVANSLMRTQSCIYCGHGDGLRMGLTVREHVHLTLRLYGASTHRADLEAAICNAGLEPSFRLCNLSAGQRRRAALCSLPLLRRRVWLLDEPSAPLDTEGVEWVQCLVSSHLKRGGVAVVATHSNLMSELPELRLGAANSMEEGS